MENDSTNPLQNSSFFSDTNFVKKIKNKKNSNILLTKREELKNAKRGIFNSKQLKKAIEDIPTSKPDEDTLHRQKLLSLKQSYDIQQAKEGKFSKKSLKAARELLGVKYTDDGEIKGALSGSNKDLSPDQIKIKQKYETLLRLNRRNEIERAKQGNFFGTNLKQQDYGLKEDKTHLQTLARLKKQADKEKSKKSTANIKKVSFTNQNESDEDSNFFNDTQSVQIGSQEQKGVIDSFLYGSNNSIDTQSSEDGYSDREFSMDTFISSLNKTKKSLSEISMQPNSKNAEMANIAMKNMKKAQDDVQQNDIKLRSGIVSSGKDTQQAQSNITSNYNIPQTKRQPNVSKPFIKHDIAANVNEKYKEYPEYKQMYG